MSNPSSCPRCDSGRASGRLGVDWCCSELRLLRDLMERPRPATMRELTHIHFIGRSEKSIDAACRRYGFKTPLRARKPRRKRCPSCADLFLSDVRGLIVCPLCRDEVEPAAERQGCST